jgi:hypothetical protein
MRKETRCGPAVRSRHRKNWSGPLAAATVAVGAALLVLGSYGGGSARARPSSAVLVGAGDIASCDSGGDRATARLLGSISGTVFTVGDNAYEHGSLSEYTNCYGPTWGRYLGRTKPAVGNHEYWTPGASGYFDYFGAQADQPRRGYYSYDRAAWHIVALNSNCAEVSVGCKASSQQVRWLKADLAANGDKKCTLALMHHPLFSSGEEHGSTPHVTPLWDVLYAAGVDVVLSGHSHNYERFARQTPSGERSPRGIREFVVGTGGASHDPIGDPIANSQVRNARTYGVLKLKLLPTRYRWKFVPVAGRTFTDSGKSNCRW